MSRSREGITRDRQTRDGLIRRDPAVQTEIVKHLPPLLATRLCQSFPNHPNWCEETACEVVEDFVIDPEKYDPDRASPHTYLYRVAYYRMVDQVRKEVRCGHTVHYDLAFVKHPVGCSGHPQLQQFGPKEELVLALIEAMPNEKQREVFKCYAANGEDYTSPPMAQVLNDYGVSDAYGRTLVQRAKSYVIEGLRKHGYKRVLLADDDPDQQRVWKRAIEMQCADVLVTGKVQEICDRAVSQTQNRPIFDALIVDCFMPRLVAPRVARCVRASGFTGLIITLTGRDDTAVETQCRAAGSDHHFIKSKHRADLRDVLAPQHAS